MKSWPCGSTETIYTLSSSPHVFDLGSCGHAMIALLQRCPKSYTCDCYIQQVEVANVVFAMEGSKKILHVLSRLNLQV